ncbi:MAG: type III-B CRISPR module RAMP protein Cmr4 [Clostridiales bacterium]|nr:type III-B CRISPR module RAMP protein Cmr4 [Clostridiales bacterium]
MYKKSSLLSIKVITPLHAGGGNNLSIIDLPIQREVQSNYPKIEASTLKGCVRNAFEKNLKVNIENSMIDIIFGCEDQNNMTASASAFSDARILFFPVRSVKGVFAYVTCPYVLKRFSNDIKLINNTIRLPNFADLKPEKCYIPKEDSSVTFSSGKTVMLDEYAFDACKNQELSDFIESMTRFLPIIEEDLSQFKNRVVVISDDDFVDFVTNATEVITRIKIDNETGIVEDKQLFNEEYMPAESILYSLVFVSDEHKSGNIFKSAEDIKDSFKQTMPDYIQIGANMTLGKGFVKCKLNWDGDTDE